MPPPSQSKSVTIPIDGRQAVSGLFQAPANPRACCVLAHGAGAGMRHALLEAVSAGLVERGLAVLRYQFPYIEQGSKRPDPPRVAHATVRAAAIVATRLTPGLPLFAGGKSFGGRMTSQAQASDPLPGVRGLVFLGFPLHPAGRPSVDRAEHLIAIRIPILFLQGTRDAFAQMDLLRPLVTRLGARATLAPVEEANHAFHVLARTGRTDAQVRATLSRAIADWAEAVLAGSLPGEQLARRLE